MNNYFNFFINYFYNCMNFYYFIFINLKKISYSPSKMFPIWMWIWFKIFSTNSFFTSFFFNCHNFLNFWCRNCINFTNNYFFKMVNFFIWWKISSFFIIILLMGLYHEWNQNMLNWII
uniref:ND3 protein n=1 Tax=Stichophthalma louisa TaxID=425061 RepID=A0A0C5APK4_9NEOP|nr:NADH dehydrogenase subunit 3 [Stichophthalma louisa]